MGFLNFILRYGRIFTLLVVVLPIVAGTYAYQTIPKEGEPEITAPIAIVITAYPGASPNEVESLVSDPLEEALGDLKDVKEMRSASFEGVSIVVIEFEVEADLERSIQKVREKVTEARGDLPQDIEDPAVEEITFSDIPIMIVSIVGDIDPIKLKRLAEDTADEIELLPEVLGTDVAGGRTREIQIFAEPERLSQYGLTFLDVYNAVKQSDVSIPGGMINTDQRRFLLRTLTEVKQVPDYADVPLIQQGDRVVFLRDVARVVDGYDEDITYSRVDGQPSVSIGVKKRAGANILETAAKVAARVKDLEKNFPAGVRTVITADQSKYIKQTFDVMNNSAFSGLAIVIFVLFFAMGLRNSIITSLSIPLSLLIAFILLKVFGISNNNLVRFSLVLCIGMLVDNAIVVVENAYHHYQLGKDRRTAVIDGVSEIALPVISATLTTMAAFLPILLMTGLMGEYMSYMPKTVSIALASSLIVALIANPLVLSRFMKQSVKGGRVVRPEEDLRRLKSLYVRLVTWAMNRKGLMVCLAVLALAWALSLIQFKVIKIEMFPDADFDYIYITIETPPGTDIDLTDTAARRVERIIEENVPEAVRVVSTVGSRGQSAYEVNVGIGTQTNFAEITIELLDGKEFARVSHKEIQQRIRPWLDEIPGADISFRPLQWGPPSAAPIVVKVWGHDLDELRRITAEVKAALSRIRGAVEIKDDFSDAPPELRVRVDRAAAASLGVPLDQLALNLRGATAGLDVRDFRDELDVSKKYNLKVRSAPEARTSPDMLNQVKVRSANGALIPLSNLAAFSQGPGVNTIRHVDRRRVVRITAQNQGRSAVEITRELQAKLADYQAPPGYGLDFSGDVEMTEESFGSLKLAYIIAFLLIFALLVAQFNSFFQPFAIMTALPLSVVGAMIGLLITGNNFSIMSFIGLVGLTGIVVNDSIVLVDCINRMRRSGLAIFEAVIEAGRQRLRPIISTTVTTIGGLFTLTITDEMWEGLGVVIIFGIGFATVLTLIVVPVMYALFEGLNYHLVSAVRGSWFKEAPAGRSFFFTRRRRAGRALAFFLLFQSAALAGGVYFLFPLLVERIQSAVIRAPSLLNLTVEAAVFVMGLVLEIGGALAVLLIPTGLGLLYLMSLRSREEYYVDVTTAGVTMTSPTEKLFLPAAEISRVDYSRLSGLVSIQAGLRLVHIRDVVEDRRTPDKKPLWRWLNSRPPSRRQIRAGLKALKEAVEGIRPKLEGG